MYRYSPWQPRVQIVPEALITLFTGVTAQREHHRRLTLAVDDGDRLVFLLEQGDDREVAVGDVAVRVSPVAAHTAYPGDSGGQRGAGLSWACNGYLLLIGLDGVGRLWGDEINGDGDIRPGSAVGVDVNSVSGL